ncbi:MAG: succinate dehydrogenase, cytochrome b556 subunit [Rickettsiaceae bacterium]
MSTKENRPTSPHLTIYKMQISSTLSILHRITGVLIFAGFALITWWFIFFVFNDFCNCYFGVFNHIISKCILFCISFAYFYHFCTGIRHLIWDMGKCFSIQEVNITGWVAVICGICLTLIFWFIIL